MEVLVAKIVFCQSFGSIEDGNLRKSDLGNDLFCNSRCHFVKNNGGLVMKETLIEKAERINREKERNKITSLEFGELESFIRRSQDNFPVADHNSEKMLA